MATANELAAVGLLAKMLTGISTTRALYPDTEETPDFSLDAFETDGDKISTTVVMPSGDQYRVSVEWLREESP